MNWQIKFFPHNCAIVYGNGAGPKDRYFQVRMFVYDEDY